GLPVRLIDCSARSASLSPDGETLAFIRGGVPWWSRGYHGSANLDLWLKSLKEGQAAVQLTKFDGRDSDPMWSADGSDVYFISDRDDASNIWAKPIDGGDARMVSDFGADGLVHARISGDGSTIVCELDAEIYAVDATTGSHHKVDIQAPTDRKMTPLEHEAFRSGATEMALSPNGKEIAFVVHGDVFAMASSEPKKWLNLTETPARESHIAWHPKGEKLAFSSDRNGNDDIFVVESSDPKEKQLSRSRHRKITPLIATEELEYAPVWSPDGKKIAYLAGRRDLWVADSDGKNSKLLVKGPFIEDVSWGPKGDFLVFSKMCDGWQSDIFIVSVDGEELHNITKNPAWDFGPRLCDDGKRIVFLSNQNTLWQKHSDYDVWHVFLTKKDEEEYRARRDGEDDEKAVKKPDRKSRKKSEAKKSEKSKKPKLFDFLKKWRKPKEGAGKPGKERTPLPFDFDDIHLRAMRISRTQGRSWPLAASPDGETYAYGSDAFGKRDIFIVDEFGKKTRQLTSFGFYPRQIVWDAKGKEFFALSGGGMIMNLMPNGMMRPVSYMAKMTIDHDAERLQMFNEAWRAMDLYFYDKDMHGVDWAAIKDKYRPMLDTAATPDEFRIILSQMVGELRASHLGVWGPRDPDFEETGQLGLDFDGNWRGKGLKVSRVIPDGPTNLPGSEIAVGDVILSVDGVQIGRYSNPFALFTGKVDEYIDLEVLRGGRGKPELVTVMPCSWGNIREKVYLAWVETRKALAERFSGGKVGYAHVQYMGEEPYKEFLRDLTHDLKDKDALIIDVRFNGGGNLHDELLSVLGRDVYFYFEDRERALKVMQPRFNWRKPVVVLINEYSHSDAEVFPNSFKELGLGKLVGVPTYGGVIFVSGGATLLDGTFVLIPRWRACMIDGKEIEGVGAQPDIYVENPPEQDYSTTDDNQLKKAVEELLEEIE
ncbi:MAG: PD40 domain-containing protein, partial [Candidatus Coatesbacteria bacterium]|nr:PD40 domain-containing protein [Candidatus Coatesbacteria bacterium]